MNVAFNPVSTTTVASPEPLFRIPSPGSLEAQAEGVWALLHSALCAFLCERARDQKLHGLRSAKAVPRLVLERTEIGTRTEENVTALAMSRPDDHRLTSLTNAIKKEAIM